MQGGQIFLSYSRTDGDFALKLGRDLRNAGIDIWIDQFDIPPSLPWDEEIQKGLDASTGLLVILSKTSVESDNVLNEINYALETQKQVWPILIEAGVKKPFNINRLQHIDFVNSYESGLALLLGSIKSGITLPLVSRQVHKKETFKYVIAGLIAIVAVVGMLTYQGIIFSRLSEQPPVPVTRLPIPSGHISGQWNSEILTNQFDPVDKFRIIFHFEVQDSILTGNIELIATPEGKGYQVKRAFRAGKISGTTISFHTLEESFKGDETIHFKNFYHGTLGGDSINFVWTSDRPWDFPEQKFVARK